MLKQFTENIKPIIGYTVVVMSMVYFFMCSIRNIKADPQILIAMVSANSIVLGYYFGSSSTKNATTENGDITVKK